MTGNVGKVGSQQSCLFCLVNTKKARQEPGLFRQKEIACILSDDYFDIMYFNGSIPILYGVEGINSCC